jgi:hypothetical protein
MTSAKTMWGRRPIHSLQCGDIEDFNAWRRAVHKVREVTIRRTCTRSRCYSSTQ